MRTGIRMCRAAKLSLLALSSLALSPALAGCHFPPVGSPEWKEMASEYEMGCRPEYAEGNEKLFLYCHRR
jgi:hypothetical protein